MINVTKPSLPPIELVKDDLDEIWSSRILSNSGPLHRRFEEALTELFDGRLVVLYNNATTALMAAQVALDVKGEIITTPYTFAATAQSIIWAGNTPVFADVNASDKNLDPLKVEAAVNERTAAIMPMHCYGSLCDDRKFSELSAKYDIPIIYDACHALGVQSNKRLYPCGGDISVFSLHATKLINSFEGAFVICNDPSVRDQLVKLRNFGFESEIEVGRVGLNGKMNEFCASVGFHQLPLLDGLIQARLLRDALYREQLAGLEGLEVQNFSVDGHNGAYLPIYIKAGAGVRDKLQKKLYEQGIFARRYFYPLLIQHPAIAKYVAQSGNDYSTATEASEEVLCLPLYPDLEEVEIYRICDLIRMFLTPSL